MKQTYNNQLQRDDAMDSNSDGSTPSPKEDKIVFVPTKCSDGLPDKHGKFLTDDKDGYQQLLSFDFLSKEWLTEDPNDGDQPPVFPPVLWYKPVPLSSLIDDKVKELEKEIAFLQTRIKDEDPPVNIFDTN